jgi:hypothetical protein
MVGALANELHVPLLVLDSSVLAPYVRKYAVSGYQKFQDLHFVAAANVRPCRILVKIVQRERKRLIIQSPRRKVRSQRWRMKVNLVKAMMKIPLNLWKI